MIPYGHQSVNQADIDCVTAVLRGEWLTTGPAVAQFESALQRWAGDTGGGIAFYVNELAVTGSRHLEFAPSGWNTGADPTAA